MTYAIPLPNARAVFLDATGKPLVGGTVAFYQPGTLTPVNTYQDFGATILNANPLTLDSLGSAIIFAMGRYRQIVKDSLGNQIWDNESAALVDQPYEAGFYFPDVPAANIIIGRWNFTKYVTFPTNFTGAQGTVGTAPNSTLSIAINKNGVSIGTMTVSTLGAVTFSSSVSSPSFSPGDYLTWSIPAGGAGNAGALSATLLGSLTQP